MQLVLSKDSDVPLRQQVADQIVLLITTGQLHAGDELPSVRALGRLSKVHHNTVSEAYQELVRRGWVTRRPGSRLVVGKALVRPAAGSQDLDDLINYSIQRARRMGYDLQALRLRVRERLLAEPPDHLLVVEQEAGLREIIRRELQDELGWPAHGCSYDTFAREPGLAIGAQVFVANHYVEAMKPFVSSARPPLGVVYSSAVEHIDRINRLEHPSIVSLVSVSEGVLRTAKSFFASAIGKKHVLQEVLATDESVPSLGDSDLTFCDSVTLGMVKSRNKVHYKLIAQDCFADLAASLG
ncbi:GntR family transcriptional regulator [Terriglobus roseus]|uniref:DNA-binding transcriptional regulator YhcF, GntR family n=1 Tax=Terriglobus roseus TaxID=392734 RepID=A0A1G7LQ60_9BACT|nr:GntR family transcriptional regulator [Terriglobus roseus]SDF51506.1 DNA-binding transcriptional regulator YhcF, GntR family [Terriglobus roseus]